MSFDRVHKAMASATNDNTEQTRRRFPRRMDDICVVAIGQTNYPVHDWSQCGVLFEGDGRIFEAGMTCDVTMKFKLSDIVTEIPVSATVVRANAKQIALEFQPMSKTVEKAFAKVIADAQAQKDRADIIG